MISYSAILQAVLPVFLVMAIGFGVRRAGLITSKGDQDLMKLAFNVFLPSFILDNVLGNPLLQESRIVFRSITLGCGWVLLGFAAAYLLAPLCGLKKGTERRTFAVSTGIHNYGFLAIPVLATLFPGKDALGVLFMHSLGVELAVWTVGIMVLSGVTQARWRLFFNGPIIAILVGLTLNYTGGHNHIPQVMTTVFRSLGMCAIPVSLVLVGATTADLLAGSKSLMEDKRVMAGACVLRLGILPLPLLAAAATLDLDPALRQVLVVQAAMPSGVFPIVLAKHYGGHTATAVCVVIATTFASLATMPLVIALGLHWTHLGVGTVQ